MATWAAAQTERKRLLTEYVGVTAAVANTGSGPTSWGCRVHDVRPSESWTAAQRLLTNGGGWSDVLQPFTTGIVWR